MHSEREREKGVMRVRRSKRGREREREGRDEKTRQTTG